jgi:hypothetical protein
MTNGAIHLRSFRLLFLLLQPALLSALPSSVFVIVIVIRVQVERITGTTCS